MEKAGAEAKSQWIAQDTRKRVTAAVMVTACRIVAATRVIVMLGGHMGCDACFCILRLQPVGLCKASRGL